MPLAGHGATLACAFELPPGAGHTAEGEALAEEDATIGDRTCEPALPEGLPAAAEDPRLSLLIVALGMTPTERPPGLFLS